MLLILLRDVRHLGDSRHPAIGLDLMPEGRKMLQHKVIIKLRAVLLRLRLRTPSTLISLKRFSLYLSHLFSHLHELSAGLSSHSGQ